MANSNPDASNFQNSNTNPIIKSGLSGAIKELMKSKAAKAEWDIDKKKKSKQAEKAKADTPPALPSDTEYSVDKKVTTKEDYDAQIEKNKIIDKANKEKKGAQYKIGDKLVTKEEFEKRKIAYDQEQKDKAAGKTPEAKHEYKIGDNAVTKEQFEAAKANPDKTSQYELNGKNVSKEEVESAKNPTPEKTYNVNGRKVTKEEFEAAKRLNELKKGNTSGKL